MSRPHDPNAKVDLLRAAEAVFVEHGLERAKVEQITARAGRSKGSFYLHFESKEDAFRQIVETLLARLSACVDEPPPPSGSPAPSVAALLERQVAQDVEVFEFLWQNRAVCRLLLGGGGSASFTYLIDQFASRSREKIRQWLAWGVARGVYRPDLDVELASIVMSGAYDQLAREMLREGRAKPDLPTLLRALQTTLGIGVFAPTATRASASRARPATDAATDDATGAGRRVPGALRAPAAPTRRTTRGQTRESDPPVKKDTPPPPGAATSRRARR